MKMKNLFLLLSSTIAFTCLFNTSAAKAWEFKTPAFIRDLDPTDRNSKLSKAAREFDPTKPGGLLEDLDKAAFEVRYCLVRGGCDITRPEVQELVKQEVENCLFVGGCDPTIPEVQNKALEYVKKIRDASEKASEFPTKLVQSLSQITDETLLNGFISRNFGHVTNKKQLRESLESKGIVIYGHEISHEDYMRATRAGVASVVASNPGPLIDNLSGLAETSYTTMLTNSIGVANKAPATLKQKYGSQLKTIESSLNQLINPKFIATSLAEYIMKGKTPSMPKLSGNLSTLSIRFGVLSYNRGENFFGEKIPTPNTHQPYILITLPELKVEVDSLLAQETKQYDEILNEQDLMGIVKNTISRKGCYSDNDADNYSDDDGIHLSAFTRGYKNNCNFLKEEASYLNVFQEAYDTRNQQIASSSCVAVDSRRGGWQRFNLNGSFTKVASIGGGWSVDSRNYSPVGAVGHTGRDADLLKPYEQYKFDQRFPFGALLMNSGNGILYIQDSNSLSSAPFGAVDMRINDADNALGDNAGSLQVCFGN